MATGTRRVTGQHSPTGGMHLATDTRLPQCVLPVHLTLATVVDTLPATHSWLWLNFFFYYMKESTNPSKNAQMYFLSSYCIFHWCFNLKYKIKKIKKLYRYK